MRVLLINPPRLVAGDDIVAPPLGLAYLAASLERTGQDVQVIDAFAMGLSFEQLEQEIKSRKPDLVGVTGMTPVIDSSFQTIKIARRYCPYVVLGGAHASALGKTIFQECRDIDAIFIGEAEETFPAFIKALEANEDWSRIPGIIPGKAPESAGPENPQRPVVERPDEIAFPARHLLPLDRYRHPLFGGDRIATLISSRGCPFQCTFCDKTIAGKKWRPRSPDNVLDEIEEIVNRFGINSLSFYDDIFTLDKQRVIQICQGIMERGINIDWKCENRINLVDDEMLGWMKKAGCRIIAYGVETPHQKGLDYLKKGVKSEQIENAFRRTREAGIQTLAYFIVGIPVETFEDEIETIRFAKHLEPDFVQFGTLSPYPGTELYKEAVEKGWYQERPAFAPAEQGTRRPLLITEYWTEQMLRDIVKRGYREFYYRPGYIIKRLFRTRSLGQLKADFVSALKGI
jgi:anaerobic magnesium-protoporphyrin IX monomethyl ester cyclase